MMFCDLNFKEGKFFCHIDVTQWQIKCREMGEAEIRKYKNTITQYQENVNARANCSLGTRTAVIAGIA
jgi:hypothetical protein